MVIHSKRAMLEVLQYLDPEECLSSVYRVCTEWKAVMQSEELWLSYLLICDPNLNATDLMPYRSRRLAYYHLFRENRYQYQVSDQGSKAILHTIDLQTKEISASSRVTYASNVCLLDRERLFLCGGRVISGANHLTGTDVCQSIEKDAQEPVNVGKLRDQKRVTCLIYSNNQVYAFGGWTWKVRNMRREYVIYDSADCWDVESWTHTQLPPLPEPAEEITAAKCSKGIVLSLAKEPFPVYVFDVVTLGYKQLRSDMSPLTRCWLGTVADQCLIFGYADQQQKWLAHDLELNTDTEVVMQNTGFHTAGNPFRYNRLTLQQCHRTTGLFVLCVFNSIGKKTTISDYVSIQLL